MRKYFTIYEEAVSHIWLCNCSILNFLLFYQCTQQHLGTYSLTSISWYMLGEILSLKISLRQGLLSRGWEAGSLSQPMRKEQILYMSIVNLMIWGRRQEGWSNMAAHLAGWRRVPPSRVWFCTWRTVHAACADGPHRLPRSGTDLLYY